MNDRLSSPLYKALDRQAQQQSVGLQRGLLFHEAESKVRRLKSEV